MNDPIYVSRSTVEKVHGAHRRLHLETGHAVDVGVHGPIKSHFRLDAERDLPLPVDYVVAATGG